MSWASKPDICGLARVRFPCRCILAEALDGQQLTVPQIRLSEGVFRFVTPPAQRRQQGQASIMVPETSNRLDIVSCTTQIFPGCLLGHCPCQANIAPADQEPLASSVILNYIITTQVLESGVLEASQPERNRTFKIDCSHCRQSCFSAG
jgi:hypothetical protein